MLSDFSQPEMVTDFASAGTLNNWSTPTQSLLVEEITRTLFPSFFTVLERFTAPRQEEVPFSKFPLENSSILFLDEGF